MQVTSSAVVVNWGGGISSWAYNGTPIFTIDAPLVASNLLAVVDDVIVTGGQYSIVGAFRYVTGECSDYDSATACNSMQEQLSCSWCAAAEVCYDDKLEFCCSLGNCSCAEDAKQVPWPSQGCMDTIPSRNCTTCGTACYDPVITPECCPGMPENHCYQMGETCCSGAGTCCVEGQFCSDGGGQMNWQCCSDECCGLQQCGGACCIVCCSDGDGCC